MGPSSGTLQLMLAGPGGVSEGLGPYSVAQALTEARTASQVTRAVFDHALRDLGATTIGLWLLGEDAVIRFSSGAGSGADDRAPSVGDIPLDSDLPAAVAVRNGIVVSYAGTEERDVRWPSLRGLESDTAVVVLPLDTGHGIIGCLHIGWPEDPDRAFPSDLELLKALAKLAAAAIDRAQLSERERRARETLEFLHQGTRLMVSALEPEAIVRSLVRLTVPRLAPWCAVYFAEGGNLHRVAVEVAGDPELARLLMSSGPMSVESEVPLAQAFRSRQLVFVPEVRSEHVLGTYPTEYAKRILSLEGDPWSALVAPVEARGEVIGVISLLSPEWRGRPPEDVRYAVQGLAGRAGIALDNARRLHDQVENVAVLTAALLPEALPDLPGMRFAAQFVPAWGGICGDWYEAELLPSGHVLVGVGDASGHGVSAAAAMAQVRNAARGLAAADMGPGQILEHLSHLALRGRAESMVTAVYALLDPATGAGALSNAGHPPPILLRADGEPELLAVPPGPPISVGDCSYGQHPMEMPPGSRLVFYTDGIYERRGEDPDAGIGRMLDILRINADADEHDLVAALLSSRPDTTDDGCVLVVGR